MRRFFIEGLREGAVEASIRGEEFRHLKVLRLREGERVTLFDGKGHESYALLTSIGRSGAKVSIEGTAPSMAEPSTDIILVAGLTKAQKPDLVVEKATELGVSAIVFYYAERSVLLVRGARIAEKLERWRRIAIGAAKQCGRSIVPTLSCRPMLASAMDLARAEAGLFFYEGGGLPLDRALEEERLGAPGSIALLIGPEGGFTEEERATALEKGYRACTLGPRILRAETAAITAVALVQHALGDI